MHRHAVNASLVGSPDARARLKRDNEVFAFSAESVEIDFGSARRHV